MGNAHYCMSNFDMAMENYKKTLQIRRQIFTENNVIVADSYYNIGRVLRRKSNFKEAVDYYLKSLYIYQKILGDEHTEVASVYEAIGNSFKSEGKFKDAM